jgi:hypothetical protein
MERPGEIMTIDELQTLRQGDAVATRTFTGKVFDVKFGKSRTDDHKVVITVATPSARRGRRTTVKFESLRRMTTEEAEAINTKYGYKII